MMKNKKFRIFGITVVVVAALAAGFGGWYFMAGSNNYKNVFYPGTTLNDMNIEGMSVSELEEQLKESAKDYELVVDFKNEQLTIKGSDIQMAYNEASDLQALKDLQNKHKLKETDQKDLALTVNNLFTYNEERVKQELAQCSAMDTTKMIAPENAQLVYDAGKNAFSLRNGEQGTTLDEGEVTAAVEDAIEENVSKLDVEAKGLYQKPVLSEDSENANKILQQANAYLQVELKYPFKKNGEKKEEVINHEQISQWVYIDEDGTLQIDHDKVQEWVNGISEKYSSKKMNMDFTTTSGSVISLNVPVSGETLDTSALFEDVLQCLTDEVSGEREVPYTESASGIKKNFGGNYVEVDLTNQKLYLYKNSELLMSSNIVSGSVSQTHMTPTGVYQVYSMEKNTVLRGADYASPVSFWMPFNGGVGFHDATWRSSFGGTIYQYNGSHGCINMPYEKAKTLYNNISTGYYVVVYGGVTYVPGQTSGSSSSSSKNTEAETKQETETKKETEKKQETETKATETKAPETSAPETSAPETSAPETNPPETSAPETSAPETSAPATNPPETSAPATSAPEEAAPAVEAGEASGAMEQ